MALGWLLFIECKNMQSDTNVNRSHKMLKSLLFFVLISIQLIAQTTYYVSNSQGNDSNNGTSQTTPWKTLSKVSSASLNPGDQVLFRRNDTWIGERLSVSRSGNQNNLISFKSYGSGNKPLINGNLAFNDYVVRVNSSVSYLKFEDIEFKGMNFTGANWPGCIKLEQRANNIVFDYCKFSSSDYDVEQRQATVMVIDPAYITFNGCEFTGSMTGVLFITNYENSKNDGHHITFTNNYFHDLDPREYGTSEPVRGVGIRFLYWFDSIQNGLGDATPGTTWGSEGVFRDIVISENTFRNCYMGISHYEDGDYVINGVKNYNWEITDNIADRLFFNFLDLCPIGWRGGLANKSIVSGNVIDSSGWNQNGSIFEYAPGGYINVIQTHNWDNVIIEKNIISNIILVSNAGDGNAIILDYTTYSPSTYSCDSIIIRNNIIYNVRQDNPPSGSVASAGINLYTSQNCETYNNVIYDSRNGIYCSGSPARNNLIYNNTIVNMEYDGMGLNSSTGTVLRNNIIANCGHLAIQIGGGITPTVSHTLFYNNGTDITGTNSVTGNPLFVNAASKNFRLSNSSPAINSGTPVISPIGINRTFDADGNEAPVGNWDIGAYEFGSTGGGTNNINVNLNILLEGSFNNGSMSTTLTNDGHLPLNQPYNQAPWNYNGNQSVSSVPAGVVDWVLLELRTGTSATTTIVRKAAFLKSDGSVVGLDGISKVTFDGLSAGSYYVVIRHRNHLAVMSVNPLSLSDNSTLYDFTTGQGKAYGTNPMSDLGNGKWGMTAGDGDINGLVNVIDYGTVGNFLFATGYIFGDLDMNGVINVMDYAKTNLNLFRNSQVPN